MDFPERDWKHLRAVHVTALARYSERVLVEAAVIIESPDVPAHERYLALVRVLRDRNREMSSAFDDMRRSTAMLRLASLVGLQLLTEAEFRQFSVEVRNSAVALSELAARPQLQITE